MKKLFLYGLIVADLGVMGVCTAFLIQRVTAPKKSVAIVPRDLNPPAPAVTPTPPGAAVPGIPPKGVSALKDNKLITVKPPVSAALTKPMGVRKTFYYKNPYAKKVVIRGEFTSWKAQPMQKAGKHVWSYTTAPLVPGEYAYCFFVDNKAKPVRDPGNKRTKRIGKNIVSAIVVKPPTAFH